MASNLRVFHSAFGCFWSQPWEKIQSAFFTYHIPVLGHFRNQWRQLGEVGSGIQQAVKHTCILGAGNRCLEGQPWSYASLNQPVWHVFITLVFYFDDCMDTQAGYEIATFFSHSSEGRGLELGWAGNRTGKGD